MARMSKTAAENSSGRKAVLSVLKREGPVSADTMGEKLGVTAMAVRQHLYGLMEEGLAAYDEQAKGRGRPVKLWRATEKANARFADAHSALASDLIFQMRKTFGDKGLDKLLKLRTNEQEKIY